MKIYSYSNVRHRIWKSIHTRTYIMLFISILGCIPVILSLDIFMLLCIIATLDSVSDYWPLQMFLSQENNRHGICLFSLPVNILQASEDVFHLWVSVCFYYFCTASSKDCDATDMAHTSTVAQGVPMSTRHPVPVAYCPGHSTNTQVHLGTVSFNVNFHEKLVFRVF